MQDYIVTWENIITKDYQKKFVRKTRTKTKDKTSARALIHKQFGNDRKIKIIDIAEDREVEL